MQKSQKYMLAAAGVIAVGLAGMALVRHDRDGWGESRMGHYGDRGGHHGGLHGGHHGMGGDGMGGDEMGDLGHMGGMAALDFDALDTDKNGMITQAEADALQTARVAAIDANNDGLISADELTAQHAKAMAERAGAMAAQMVARLDSDADGQLSAAELAAYPMQAVPIAKLDADGDGAVSRAEADAAQAAMTGRRNTMSDN